MWILTEDPWQARAAALHGWWHRLLDRQALLAEPPALPWRETLRQALPPGTPPASITLTTGRLPDFLLLQQREAVVSARLAAALALPETAAQLLPLAVFAEDPAALAMGYRLLRVQATASCLDRAASEFEVMDRADPRTGLPDPMTWCRRYIPDAGITPPADLFWPDEQNDLLVATEALARRVMAGGFTGIAFADPHRLDEFGRRTHRRRADGGTEPFPEAEIGVTPVRDPAGRPAFAPDPELPAPFRPIEAAVRHRLPAEYVALLADPPPRLAGCPGAEYELMLDPAAIAALNRTLRESPEARFLVCRPGWPEDWLAIGQDGCGSYVMLDLGAPGSPVLDYDHDFGGARVRATLLENHAREVEIAYLGEAEPEA